ncbi:MAG TPA: NTP transferase domain-containing protein [Chthonomonadales bacterium]|nr:NTP transferase domain-containing protein [Chthonomonadales bacterium]
MASIPRVVLAGGAAKPDLQAATGQSVRALVEVGGKTLLQTILQAVSEDDAPVAVVGNVPPQGRSHSIPDSGDFVTNVTSGLTHFRSAPFVLLATSDLPFITSAAVVDFVERAVSTAGSGQTAMVWPIVEVAKCYQRYPGVKRTALKLREGEFTGGNLMLVRPEAILEKQSQIADAYASRKSPLRIAALLGMGTVLRLAISQIVMPSAMGLRYLEQRVSALLGAGARAVISPYPEIATDLDRASDFAAVSYLEERSHK